MTPIACWYPFQQPGRLYFFERGPWALRPRLTAGLPFSLAHTDALARRHIPNLCYERIVYRSLTSRNTLWKIFTMRAKYLYVVLRHMRYHRDDAPRSSPELILLVYSPERHGQLAGARAANRGRRVMAVGIPFSQLAIRPTLTAAAVTSSCRWVFFKPR